MSQQQSTAQIILAILNLLASSTDAEHGIPLHDIGQRVGATDKTVRAHLRAMSDAAPLGRNIRHLTRQWLSRNANSPDATYGWYIEPAIDPAVARLIADGLTLARIDDATLQEIVDDLRPLAGVSMRDDEFHVTSLQSSERLNREFLVNVQKLDEAIDTGRRITYRYCAYDARGELVPRTDHDGNPRTFEADPYRLFYKNGRYYLLCHRIGLEGLSYLYVDRFRNLCLCDPGTPLSKRLDDFAEDGAPFDVERHLDEHPYTVSTRTVDVTMRVRHALEPVFDWFPNARVEPSPDGDESYLVHVRADEMATIWWALQFSYHDRYGINRSDIEILEPATLRDKLRDAGRQLIDRYGDAQHRDAQHGNHPERTAS